MPSPGWKKAGKYRPRKRDRFAFGLWCVMNRGRDPFGAPTRPSMRAVDAIAGLARRGCSSFEFHDNDLVPMDADAAQQARVVRQVKEVMAGEGIAASMATTDMFYHPVFKDGAFTSNDAKVRAYAVRKAMRAIDLGAELGARVFVFWGGREGTEVDASKTPQEALKRMREAINFLSAYVKDQGHDMVFALEPKPNEPRGDIFLPTVGHVLAFIASCEHAEMLGVNPEIQHSRMVGLNARHDIGMALEAGKLFDIHLGAQKVARFDQDLRFGSEDIKETFFVVKLLEDAAWTGTRAFDCHPYRSEDAHGVWEFVEACMRTYLIFKEKVALFNGDRAIRALLEEIKNEDAALERLIAEYTSAGARKLLARKLDPDKLARRKLRYEVLDQLTQEILMGVR